MKRPADAREEWGEQVYAPDPRAAKDHPFLFWFFTAIAFFLVAVAFAAWSASKVRAEGIFRFGENANTALCRGWIDVDCSCSHRSCWEARPGEFVSLGNGQWREAASGTVKTQRGWSKDGSFVACAWKNGSEPGVQFRVGRGNPISCLYPPLPAF